MSQEEDNFKYDFFESERKQLAKTDHATQNIFIHNQHEQFVHQCLLNDYEHKVQQDLVYFSHKISPDDDFFNIGIDDLYQDIEDIDVQSPEKQPIVSLENQKSFNFQNTQGIFQNKKSDTNFQVDRNKSLVMSKKWKKKMNQILQQKSISDYSDIHNRNMPKFFVRIYLKYLKISPLYEQLSTQQKQRLNQISVKKCINLKDLQQLFGDEDSCERRKFLCFILNNKLKNQVIKSHDVQNKKAYLLCSKVYTLRCMFRHLVGRVQSKI